jgi:Cof subfamily protein (haloacid dehalogenase superfamily)
MSSVVTWRNNKTKQLEIFMTLPTTSATTSREREVSSTRTPATIRLLLADVDGTLVTHEKVLTQRARDAVTKMRSAGIQFAITSGRPPRGMEMLIAPLALTTPIAAFNGGMFVKPDLSVIEQRVLQADIIEPAMETMRKHGLDTWIYRGTAWFVHDRHGPHVDREEWTVKFPPTVVSNFTGLTNDVAKLVGVSDDLKAVCECETAVREQFATKVHTKQTNPQRENLVSAARSQPYYLDVTHPDANKGYVVTRLSEMLDIPIAEIATIGDMPNDIAMFKNSGISIAMGQAGEEVRSAATYTTSSSEEEGFAKAVEHYVLNRAP